MKDTNFFTQSYKQIGSITATATCQFNSYDSMDINLNDLPVISIRSTYNVTLSGPFISFQNADLSQDTKSIEFYLFTPYYMVRKIALDTIQLVPIHELFHKSHAMKFDSELECTQWIEKIRKVRSLINEVNFNLPPVVAHVLVYDPTGHQLGVYEINYLNKQIIFNASAKSSSIPPVKITLNSYIIPPLECSYAEINQKGKSIIIKSKQLLQEYMLSFESFDLLKFTFITIYISIKQLIKKSSKPPPVNLAKPFSERVYDLEWPDMEFTSMQQQPITETNSNNKIIKFKAHVDIPEKASSHLELLKFDLPISRRVYFVNSKEKTSKKQNFRSKSEEEISFSSELIKIQNESRTQIPPLFNEISKSNFPKYKIDFLSKEFMIPGSKLCEECIMKPLCSPQTKKILENFGFEIPERGQPIYGTQYFAVLSKLVTEIREFNLNDEAIISIITILAKIMSENTVNSFYEELTKMVDQKIDNIEKLAIFISRVFYMGIISRFLSSLSSSMFSYLYTESSLLKSPEFIELLRASLQPILKTKFSGIFPGVNHDLKISPRFDTKIRNDTIILKQKLRNGESLPLDIISDIVYNVSQFFSSNYKPPTPIIAKSCRNSFYCFQVAISGIFSETTELLALKQTVTNITSTKTENLVCYVVISGLKLGMVSSWVAAAISAARTERLCLESSMFKDEVIVANLIDSLNSLSSIFFEINDDEILSFPNPFNN